MRLAFLIATFLLAALPAQAERLRLAVTTSFQNSGLSDVLLPAIARDTGLDVQLLVVGTGQAIRLGEAGDVDAVLVHARAAEEAMVAAGHATHRRLIMSNDFVLIGPEGDPAGIAGAETAADAVRAIAESRADFVSRGDDSGTHMKERALWQAAGVTVFDPGWYHEAGAGMGATLNIATGMGAYTLTDRASWLNFGNRAGMALLFAGDPALENPYSFLPVNPARHPGVKAEAALALEDWLTSPRGQEMIAGYQVGGEAPFKARATTP